MKKKGTSNLVESDIIKTTVKKQVRYGRFLSLEQIKNDILVALLKEVKNNGSDKTVF
jgi:hypothetical protein